MSDIGIYIHIPFCKSKCNYCDFTSFANKEENIKRYIDALKNEIIQRAKNSYNVKTIFIGGGTPSIIEANYIEELLTCISNNYKVSKNVEITIEANPGTVDKNKLKKYYDIGINRLSVGLQSANDNILKELGRIHNYKQYIKTIEEAKKVGFKNINTDIMIGLPNQTIYDVEDTIDKLIDLDLQHISVYSLILEIGTKLEKMVMENKVQLPDEEIERYMYWFAKRKLEENGFEHYEISNFAKPGFNSNHNLDCWNQKEYLGFGISAASYVNKMRFVNTSSLEAYMKNIEQNEMMKNIKIEEKQSTKSQMDEFILLGLRKIDGVNIKNFKNKFKKDPLIIYNKKITKLLLKGLILIDTNSIKLSNKGLDLANVVWEEFV